MLTLLIIVDYLVAGQIPSEPIALVGFSLELIEIVLSLTLGSHPREAGINGIVPSGVSFEHSL